PQFFGVNGLDFLISYKLGFNSQGSRRQHPQTTEATASTHYSQPTLSACAERRQAGISSILLLTTDGRRYTQINGCR
ncbi:MAG: hypothetical protein K8R08_12130, partial [Methanosarcinales archaeon]|nr:hypothetical protein [Methanosarcinales archaeon]